jgi:hypothetical protein
MTSSKKHTAYEGPKFTIEWYYTEDGKFPALEYFKSLNKHEKAQTFRLFELIAKEGKILNIQKFRHEGNGIYAFKPKPHRFLCFFFEGKKLLLPMDLKRNERICLLMKKNEQ